MSAAMAKDATANKDKVRFIVRICIYSKITDKRSFSTVRRIRQRPEYIPELRCMKRAPFDLAADSIEPREVVLKRLGVHLRHRAEDIPGPLQKQEVPGS